MEEHPGTGILSRTRYGHVHRCQGGCTHVTFGSVSLHFESEDDFEGFVDNLLAQEKQHQGWPAIEVCYNFTTLTLTPLSVRAFIELVKTAVDNISWFRGDCHLTEAEEWLLLYGDMR
ncbi:hypothetical protein EON79_08635 [bacterium]|nr:MAG: hypothetical protein EON79_08635 [bacterium]